MGKVEKMLEAATWSPLAPVLKEPSVHALTAVWRQELITHPIYGLEKKAAG
jgi:hypothetical protein